MADHGIPITISVRYYGGAYVATALKTGMRASSTNCARVAAEAAARKLFGEMEHEVKEIAGMTFVAKQISRTTETEN